MSNIVEGARVQLNFRLALEDGTEVDSNFGNEPVNFVVGDGSLLPGFEACLDDAVIGEEQRFLVTPEHAFGQPNSNNVQEIAREHFDAAMELEPGLVCSFADAAGGELPGVIVEAGAQQVIVDFNHPLAGHTICFDVLVHRVEAPEAS